MLYFQGLFLAGYPLEKKYQGKRLIKLRPKTRWTISQDSHLRHPAGLLFTMLKDSCLSFSSSSAVAGRAAHHSEMPITLPKANAVIVLKL